MWSNAGFADVFIVFAKIEKENITAFILKRSKRNDYGEEEHKLGLHSSSTRQIFFNEARFNRSNVGR